MTLTEITRRLGEARIRVQEATDRRDEEQVQLDLETGVLNDLLLMYREELDRIEAEWIKEILEEEDEYDEDGGPRIWGIGR